MSWWEKYFVQEEKYEDIRATSDPESANIERDMDKLDFHIRRFRLALEQCTNPRKRPELEKNLRYYENLKLTRSIRGD